MRKLFNSSLSLRVICKMGICFSKDQIKQHVCMWESTHHNSVQFVWLMWAVMPGVLCFRISQNKIRSIHSFCYTLLSTKWVSEPLLSTYENCYSHPLLLDSFYFQITPLLVFGEIVKSVHYVCLLKFYLFATFWNETHSSLGFVILQGSLNGYFFQDTQISIASKKFSLRFD